ncbi:MAG: NAD-dependent deacylase [Deinococcales bacterium]
MPLAKARKAIQDARTIAVLTGAGISRASGLATFRNPKSKDAQGDHEVLWQHYRPEDLATPYAYAKDPLLVWQWYAMRFEKAMAAEPNEAHLRLAGLEKNHKLTLVTQNVDGLHLRAGSQRVLELHGNLCDARCESCESLFPLARGFKPPPFCPHCGQRSRPNVVWFGESLPYETFAQAVKAFEKADVSLIIGTSSVVEPAASLARLSLSRGAYVIEINPEVTPLSNLAQLSLRQDAISALAMLLA